MQFHFWILRNQLVHAVSQIIAKKAIILKQCSQGYWHYSRVQIDWKWQKKKKAYKWDNAYENNENPEVISKIKSYFFLIKIRNKHRTSQFKRINPNDMNWIKVPFDEIVQTHSSIIKWFFIIIYIVRNCYHWHPIPECMSVCLKINNNMRCQILIPVKVWLEKDTQARREIFQYKVYLICSSRSFG